MSSGRGSKKYREAVERRSKRPAAVSPSIDELLDKFTAPPRSTVPPDNTVPPSVTVLPQHSEPYRADTEAPPDTVPHRSTLAFVDGYTQIPNTVLESLLPTLHVHEQAVYLRLYRLSHGFGKDTCKVGYKKLQKACNLGKTSVQKTIDGLEAKGWIEVLSRDDGAAARADRGSVYRVNVPGNTVPRRSREPRGGTVPRGNTVPSGSPYKDSKEMVQTPLPKLVEAVTREFHRVMPQATEQEIDDHLQAWAREQGHDPRAVAAMRRRA